MFDRFRSVAVVVLGLWAASANADTIYVCWDGSGDYLTIQAGIDAAQDGDTVLVADGTYQGVGNYDLDFLGKAITVRSANGPSRCIIQCAELGLGFYFWTDEGPDAVVQGFTIAAGHT
ncbi:MAG TPA: hypothetical protein VM487_04080 [Phycisphaerae bacterium]|nr:hypothetical protein [Phycisphaerae bacterium]